jgi:hypothetical protein
MFLKPTISRYNVARKVMVCFALIAVAALTFGSTGGGGGNKNSSLSFNKDFTTIRTTGGFTLKAGPMYRGSQLLNMQKQKDVVLLKSVVTYQKGNTTFILPYQYKMAKPAMKSNLNAVDVKINLHK